MQNAKQIVEYAQETFFKHLRLYEMVFNNKQSSEIKVIKFIIEEAMPACPLDQALMLSNFVDKGEAQRLET